MKLEKRLRKLIVVAVISLVFVSLTTLNAVYAVEISGTTGGSMVIADDITTFADSPQIHLNTGGGTWIRIDSANKSDFLVGADGKGFSIYNFTKGKYRVVVKANGNVGIGTFKPKGKLDVNGSIFQRGGSLHADYVFENDYELESIKEHASFMWKNKHLSAIPKAKTDETGQEIVEVGAHRKGIVEELEKAHIYIEQLEKRIGQQDKQLREALAVLADRQKALEDMFLAGTTIQKEKLAKLGSYTNAVE